MLTLRRDTSQGVASARTFIAFTTEAGRILINAGLTPTTEIKQVHPRHATGTLNSAGARLHSRSIAACPTEVGLI